MLEIQDILHRLCETVGPSGHERRVAESAAELLAPFAERVETDRLGSVLGYVPCGQPDAPVLMLDAHLDSVGIMVTSYEDGYAQFRSIGGLDPRVMPAKTIRFLTEPPMFGVVACLPPHVQSAAQQKKVPPLDELYIDTGGAAVSVGTVGVFVAEGFALGEKQYVSPALDDRVCFAVLLRTLELLPAVELLRGQKRAVDIVVCGSVMEECGGQGAAVAAFAIKPDYAVAVDVGFGKSPDTTSENSFKVGGGPILTVGPECSRKMTDKFKEIAKKAEIPLQIEVVPRDSGTNGTDIMLSRQGVATAVLGVPLKYMHTCVETVHLRDVENTARLLAEYIVQLQINFQGV